MSLDWLLRRVHLASVYLWFAAQAAFQLAKRAIRHILTWRWPARVVVVAEKRSWWKRLPRLPFELARLARTLARLARGMLRMGVMAIIAIDRITTTRLFELIGNAPNASKYLDDIAARASAGKPSALTLACAVGLAAKCERAELATSLARRLLREYPDEIGLLQHAGTQTFIAGDYANAEFVWDACNRRREQLLGEKQLDRLGLRILGPSWVIAIGHIAHLDIYFKWRELTGRKHKAVLTIPVGFKIPNGELLDRWRPFLEPEIPSDIKLTLPQVEILQDEFWSLPVGEGRWRMFSHAGAWVQSEWEKRGGLPLLALSQDDRVRGRDGLRRLGVPDGAWYVCLHVREPGFHKAWHKHHPGTRNADILTYTEAIEAVTERGGYVVRMGDSSMRRLPPMDKVIDYAHSDQKSEFMDLFLCASCRSFIGTNSGLGLVPPVYGVPCALTNWSPIGLPQWYPNDLFIPKLCHSERLGRLLTFEEMFHSKAGWGQFADYFERERISVLDNDPNDLHDLVIEMLDRESGSLRDTPEDAALYDSYLRLALDAGSYAGARIGRKFLRKHRDLLPGREENSPAAHASAPRYAAG